MEEGWLEMLSFENTQKAAALQGVGVCVAGKTRVKKKKGAKNKKWKAWGQMSDPTAFQDCRGN